MTYYIWLKGSKEGPYSLEKLRALLEKGTINANTLCAPLSSQGDWSSLEHVLKSNEEPLLPDSDSHESTPERVKDEVGWVTFLHIQGVLLIVIGAVLLFSALNHKDKAAHDLAAYIAAGSMGLGLNAFFVAFLVNVFTDIRWLLQESLDLQKAKAGK